MTEEKEQNIKRINAIHAINRRLIKRLEIEKDWEKCEILQSRILRNAHTIKKLT